MKRPLHGRGRRSLPCSSLHADDGIDPRRPFSDPSRSGPDRKTLQLCGQVERLLALALAGLAADDVLAEVRVVAVEPAPDATRLRVLVEIGAPDVARSAVLARLSAAKGMLRSEIAAGVCRRKAPDLVFVLSRPGAEPGVST